MLSRKEEQEQEESLREAERRAENLIRAAESAKVENDAGTR